MSVQTQIDRLSEAKTSLSTWLTDNGVTVPDGTLMDGLVALLIGVKTGGGLPEGITAIATGTFTPSAEISAVDYDVEHGLGATPTRAILFPEDNGSTVSSKYGIQLYAVAAVPSYFSSDGLTRTGMLVRISGATDGYSYGASTLTSTLLRVSAGTNLRLLKGVRYRWYVWY